MTVTELVDTRVPLSRLLAGLRGCGSVPDIAVTQLTSDSREVTRGACFVAVRGTTHNGADYLGDAATRGASVALLDADQSVPDASRALPIVRVADLAANVGRVAANFYEHPSHVLDVVAVTGTNGKTTVAHVCAQALECLGRRCGYIGTLGAGRLEQLVSHGMTTPDPITLQRMLRELVTSGHGAVALEASSHALAQSRLSGTAIEAAVFTGLGHDHLDYHLDPAAYAAAKQRLFVHPGLRHAILNADSSLTATILRQLDPTVRTTLFALTPPQTVPDAAATIVARDVVYAATGTRLEVATQHGTGHIESALIGDFNVQNLLAVLGALLALNVPLADACAALSRVVPVAGRMQRFGGVPPAPTVFVDYAHSPDSLERVLRVLRGFSPRRLWCVFGCGGERDRTKRPLMGAIAARYADDVVVTSDNPRGEDPAAIMDEIAAGATGGAHVRLIPEREAAIRTALDGAVEGDIVLIAGKGHEAVQEVRGVRVPMSDQRIVRAWLESRA